MAFVWCELLTLVAVLVAAPNDELSRALDARDWRGAGKLMGRIGVDALELAVLRRIVRQDAQALAAMRAGLDDHPSPSRELVRLLRGLHAARSSEPRRAVQQLEPLAVQPRLLPVVIEPLGRSALHLCRAGSVDGIEVLEAIRHRFPDADWAHANIALGQRLLGRYREAGATYRGMVAKFGERAWILNDLGLLAQAEGSTADALKHYLRGASGAVPGSEGERDTCRGNAAMLLLQRDAPGDRQEAVAMLRAVTSRDPTRERAAYWLAQVSRIRARLVSGKAVGPAAAVERMRPDR